MTARDVDLLAEEYAEQWPEDTDNDTAILARAYLRLRGERDDARNDGEHWFTLAKAAEARLAAVAALADEWEQDYPSALAACNREPDEWWIDLRAALATDAAPSPGVEACSECGHHHTPEGCTGDPTPSDRWAGVPVSACDCDPAPTPAAPTDEGARLGEGHDFLPVKGHPDDDECTYRADGTDATYCGKTRGEHE